MRNGVDPLAYTSCVTNLLVKRRGGNLRVPFLVIRHGNAPGAAADLTVLHVVLEGSAARVDADFIGLAAIRADDDAFGVRRTVAERKFLVEIVVGEIDHAKPTSCVRAAPSHAPYDAVHARHTRPEWYPATAIPSPGA